MLTIMPGEAMKLFCMGILSKPVVKEKGGVFHMSFSMNESKVGIRQKSKEELTRNTVEGAVNTLVGIGFNKDDILVERDLTKAGIPKIKPVDIAVI